MSDDMKELKSDVKEIKADIKVMSETLLRNTLSLEVHEKRTTIAEGRLNHFDDLLKWAVGLVISGAAAILMKLFLH